MRIVEIDGKKYIEYGNDRIADLETVAKRIVLGRDDRLLVAPVRLIGFKRKGITCALADSLQFKLNCNRLGGISSQTMSFWEEILQASGIKS